LWGAGGGRGRGDDTEVMEPVEAGAWLLEAGCAVCSGRRGSCRSDDWGYLVKSRTMLWYGNLEGVSVCVDSSIVQWLYIFNIW
jgi:hypothetical protein